MNVKNQDSDKKGLTRRIRTFVLDVWSFCDELPNTSSGRNCINQTCRAASSVGANFRAAFRGRSRKEFIAKMGIAIEEIDECCYWLDLIAANPKWPRNHDKAKVLYHEAYQLTAILVSISVKYQK